MKTEPKWIAHTKGGPNQRCWEIAVVREDFKHGFESHGWYGEGKLLISSDGGPSCTPVIELVWSELVAVAEKVATKLNKPTTSNNLKDFNRPISCSNCGQYFEDDGVNAHCPTCRAVKPG